jgi:hypothetical protein
MTETLDFEWPKRYDHSLPYKFARQTPQASSHITNKSLLPEVLLRYLHSLIAQIVGVGLSRMHLFPLYIDTGLDLKHRLLLTSGLQLVLATYQFAIAGKCKPGLLRFAVSLPCLAGLVLLPAFFRWQQEEVLLRTSLIFTCAWLGTFKVREMHAVPCS